MTSSRHLERAHVDHYTKHCMMHLCMLSFLTPDENGRDAEHKTEATCTAPILPAISMCLELKTLAANRALQDQHLSCAHPNPPSLNLEPAIDALPDTFGLNHQAGRISNCQFLHVEDSLLSLLFDTIFLPMVVMESAGPSSSHTRGTMPCSSRTASWFAWQPAASSASAQATLSAAAGSTVASVRGPVSGMATSSTLGARKAHSED